MLNETDEDKDTLFSLLFLSYCMLIQVHTIHLTMVTKSEIVTNETTSSYYEAATKRLWKTKALTGAMAWSSSDVNGVAMVRF